MPDDLDRELDDLAAAAQRHRAQHEAIPDLAWPEGARIAVNFTADFDAMLLRRLMDEPPMQLAKGEFGGRVGIWRLVELFDGHGVKATIFTPGRICELYPQAVLAAARSGHEVADHMWEHRVPEGARPGARPPARGPPPRSRLSRAGGRSARAATTATACCGSFGYLYRSNGSADHRPHYQWDADGRGCLVNLPFHYAIDDAMFFSFAWMGTDTAAQRMADPERVLDLWWDAFRQQYRQPGGYLNICLHPFVSGRALRIAMLDRLIARMKELPGVWFASCEAVARHCLPPTRRAAGGPEAGGSGAPCPGRTVTPSPTSGACQTRSCAGPTARGAASALRWTSASRPARRASGRRTLRRPPPTSPCMEGWTGCWRPSAATACAPPSPCPR